MRELKMGQKNSMNDLSLKMTSYGKGGPQWNENKGTAFIAMMSIPNVGTRKTGETPKRQDETSAAKKKNQKRGKRSIQGWGEKVKGRKVLVHSRKVMATRTLLKSRTKEMGGINESQ